MMMIKKSLSLQRKIKKPEFFFENIKLNVETLNKKSCRPKICRINAGYLTNKKNTNGMNRPALFFYITGGGSISGSPLGVS